MVIIVSVILCALLNLSLDRAGTKREIWISLLGTTVGNIMPTPKIKNHYPTELTVTVCKDKVKMSSFNIIVPSDTNSNLYPENTSSRFKVRLSEPIELDQRGNWEVALAELQVPAKLQKQDYQMVVDSTHPDSTEQRKTTNREDFLSYWSLFYTGFILYWFYMMMMMMMMMMD